MHWPSVVICSKKCPNLKSAGEDRGGTFRLRSPLEADIHVSMGTPLWHLAAMSFLGFGFVLFNLLDFLAYIPLRARMLRAERTELLRGRS